MKVQALCIFVLILVVALAGTSARKNKKCPFDYLYHLGDTTSEIGNAVLIKPWGPHLPAAHLPFGVTDPGYPTGRWCDGYIDFDFESALYDLPNIVPYLGLNGSTEYDGVMFSVAWSPVLDRCFFESRGIEIPPYVVSLNDQMKWFKEHMNSIAPTPEAIAERLQDSLVFLGDIEGNDVMYALTQGKSIEEVKTYVPYIVETEMNVTRELIAMGATRIIIPDNFPIGCTPYILTELGTDDPDDYDEIGCLDPVDELIKYKNKALQEAIANIGKEFPNISVYYAEGYETLHSFVKNASTSGLALKACCGVGGKYNYDSKRFCGSPEATVCSNPGDYVWWDGIHQTQEAYRRIVSIVAEGALAFVNCNATEELSEELSGFHVMK